MRRVSRDESVVVRLRVNGEEVRGRAHSRTLLSDFLRHSLGLTGTHVGCEHGVCGACTVLIDGEPARACLTLAIQAEERELTTGEGVGDDPVGTALHSAFARHHALQCGFCTPGILVSALSLLRTRPNVDEATVRDVLGGHLCRCTGYTPIVRAVMQVARELEATRDA